MFMMFAVCTCVLPVWSIPIALQRSASIRRLMLAIAKNVSKCQLIAILAVNTENLIEIEHQQTGLPLMLKFT